MTTGRLLEGQAHQSWPPLITVTIEEHNQWN